MSNYLVTIEFDDGALAITQYSSASDVRSKLAEVIGDLTDEDSIEHFRSVTVTQAARAVTPPGLVPTSGGAPPAGGWSAQPRARSHSAR